MKRTYNETMIMSNEKLQNVKVILYTYEEDKYTGHTDDCETRVEYTGLTAWDIIEGGKEADEIEKDGLVDEHHEYLVLHFVDGTQATFRNSHVDMFMR